MMGFLSRFMARDNPAPESRCNLREAATEIAHKERHLAELKMQREAVQAEIRNAFQDLLRVRSGEKNGDP